MTALEIDGPSGPLQAEFTAPEQPAENRPAALLAHPHPQMGGNMHDLVLDTAARVLLDHGIACLRFNFRGAGASAGSFDNGDGERDDLRAALDWLGRETNRALSLAGYSFGSWVGWRVIHEDQLNLERIMLIAPPVAMLDYPDGAISGRLDAFAGTADGYVDGDALTAWTQRNAATHHTIEGADHFFGGHYEQLAQAIESTFT